MLVLVTLVCIYLGWTMNWIRQREAILKQAGQLVFVPDPRFQQQFKESPGRNLVSYGGQPPFLLRPFRVRGVRVLHLGKTVSLKKWNRLHALFPEANVVGGYSSQVFDFE